MLCVGVYMSKLLSYICNFSYMHSHRGRWERGNYEVINGNLKIYQTKTYKNNYKVANKKRYDLWELSGSCENCKVAKITTKKLIGYYRKKDGYKWCKIQNHPRAVFYGREDFKF
jgi:hypothetical protein